MVIAARQILPSSKTVQSPVRGWAHSQEPQGSPAGLKIAPGQLEQLIAGGPERAVSATVPTGCPLPAGDLASYASESGAALACVDCHFYRELDLAEGGGPLRLDRPPVRYGLCTAPERGRPALVSVQAVDARTRSDTDSRVLACLRAGVTAAASIAEMTGIGERVVYKAVRRLKDEGTLPAELRIPRSA